MNYLKTNSKGRNKAKDVLDEIGFDEVTQLSNSDLVSGFGIVFISKPLKNADGKIIRGKTKTIIKVKRREELNSSFFYFILINT